MRGRGRQTKAGKGMSGVRDSDDNRRRDRRRGTEQRHSTQWEGAHKTNICRSSSPRDGD